MRLPAVYLFFFLLLATTQNGFQHQTGIHSLLLPSLTQQGTVTRPFTLVFDERFSTIPTVVFSIAGFEELTDRGLAVIDITSTELTQTQGSFLVEATGVSLIQISYFFVQRQPLAKLGLIIWDRTLTSTSSSEGGRYLEIVERRFRKHPLEDYSLMQEEQKYKMILFGEDMRMIQAITLPKQLSFLQGKTTKEFLPMVESESEPLRVAVDVILPSGSQKQKISYFLLLQLGVRGDRTTLIVELESRILRESESWLLSERGGAMLTGIAMIDARCSKKAIAFEEKEGKQLKINLKRECSEIVMLNAIWLKQLGKKTQQSRMLATLTCISGTMANYWNWTALLTVTNRNSLKASTTTLTCMPCPIGCLTCQNVTGVPSSCWNAYCLACDSQYNIAVRTDYISCTNRQYCKCKTAGQFQNSANGNCQACSSVIPNCISCSAHEWAGTFCTQCATGFYGAGGNMPRTCSPCSPGCTVCSSSASCSTCGSSFVKVSGACVCNTTQNMFFNSVTGTCTSCSTAITYCTSCTGSTGTSTVCASCSAGFYPSSTTCISCQPLCTSCTSSSCTACTDSSFVISGPACVCDASAEMFVSTTLNTCLACSTLIPSCVDCSGSNSSALTCVACISGYYFDGSSCLQCTPKCDACANGTSCNNCTATFIYDNVTGTCVCDSANDYVLNPAGTACVQCSFFISYCSTCTVLPTPTCTACDPPYYLASSTTCSQCPPSCLSCISLTDCGSSCVSGYSGLDCTTCTGCVNCPTDTGDPFCAACTGAVCDDCMVGYFMDAGDCTQCPAGCITCTNSSSCGSCSLPFLYVAPNCVCNTAVEQYFDGTTCTTCSSVIAFCTVCSSTDGLATTCTACATGSFLLNSTICQTCPTNSTACTSASVSTACLPTFSLIGGLCVCDSVSQKFLDPYGGTCQLCSDLIPDCTTCAANGTLSTGVECVLCIDGFYIDPSYNCSACPVTCLTCTSPTSCVDCVTGYSMLNGSCACDSTAQMFDAGSYCSPCYTFINLCTECTGTGPSNVTCLSSPQGTYLASDNLSCIACPSNCNSCDATGCLVCAAGFSPSSGACAFLDTCASFSSMDPNCLACDTIVTTDNTTGITTSTNVCLTCQQGTFLFGGSTCVACPPSCATCTSFLNCLTCQPTYSLISGACSCDPYNNEVEHNGACTSCSALVVGCQTCNSTVEPVKCTVPLPTFYVSAGVVSACPTGCSACLSNSSCSACIDGYSLDPVALTCTNAQGCTTLQYFDGSICQTCNITCLSCLSSTVCLSCQPLFTLIGSACTCDTSQGYFYTTQTSHCEQCSTFNSSTYDVYTANCQTCIYSTTNLSISFQCSICNPGYYLSAGSCYTCQTGCNRCTGGSSCYQCATGYVYSGSLCVCDTLNNYFSNGTGCELCSLPNCVICTSLTDCSICETGYFLNFFGVCQTQICGDGLVDGSEECDDGNTVNGDGCSSICLVELYYLCNSPSPGHFNSSCYLDTDRFVIEYRSQVYSCNHLNFTFELTGTQSFSHCDFDGFFLGSNLTASYLNFSVDGNFLTYSYELTESVQDNHLSFVFDPSTLCVSDSYNFIVTTLYVTVNPDNNYPAMYYPLGTCGKQKEVEQLVAAVEYTSYGVLMLSALPCKIVGLELFGVLQLSFLSLGSIDNVNLMLSPLKKMKGVNGFSLNLGKDSSSRRLQVYTPERINSIDYNANFIRNVNVMLFLVGGVVGVAFVLYLLTFCFKNCAPTLHRVAKRLFKEVLLTLILFNILNFAYSAGIHFKYAPREDSLYGAGTAAAVLTLVLAVVMAIGLECAEEEGFGQFKDKMRKGALQRAYFVVTIVYRLCIGLYLSMANEDDLSTLIILAVSIMFLIYNLVNLPFAHAYHNYRANICHLTQFVTLFVAMYYRSMMSTTPLEGSAYTYGPVYLEYGCIVISLVVSLVVLAYEIYLFIKNCCCSDKERVKTEQSSVDVNRQEHNHANQTLQNIQRGDKVVFQEEGHEMYN